MESSSSSRVGSLTVAVHGIFFFFFCRVTSFIILKILLLIGVAHQRKNLLKTNKTCKLCCNYCCTATGLEHHSLWLWLWLNDSAWSITASTHSMGRTLTSVWIITASTHSMGRTLTSVWIITATTHSMGRTLTSVWIITASTHSMGRTLTSVWIITASTHSMGRTLTSVWIITATTHSMGRTLTRYEISQQAPTVWVEH